MIDYIKFVLPLNNVRILRNNLDFIGPVDLNTGEPKKCCDVATIECFRVQITPKEIIVSGSLHKYFNIKSGLGNHNYNDFPFKDLCISIMMLEKDLGVPIQDGVIQNLEVGFNLLIGFNPTALIMGNIMMYDFKTHNSRRTYQGTGYFVEFAKSQFYFKVYDKGLQYNQPNDILRIEIKHMRSHPLNLLGVYHVKDLMDYHKHDALGRDLLKRFSGLLIVDDLQLPTTANQKDSQFYAQALQHQYWAFFSRSSSTKLREKRRLSDLINQYNLHTRKDYLETQLGTKLNRHLQAAKKHYALNIYSHPNPLNNTININASNSSMKPSLSGANTVNKKELTISIGRMRFTIRIDKSILKGFWRYFNPN